MNAKNSGRAPEPGAEPRRRSFLPGAIPGTLLRATALVALGLQIAAGPLTAGICAPDTAPAATLLIPYFEVDLAKCGLPILDRRDTEFSIANTSSDPVLAGVTIWSDWGVPVTGFQVYLPGQSSRRMVLGEFLCTGNLPQTGAGVSVQTAGTGPLVPLASCNNSAVPGFAPNYANPAAPPYFLQHIQEALTGERSSLDGYYYGEDWGDGRARGHLTIDAVGECHLLNPTDPGYFISGGLGIATNQNVLLGDYLIRDDAYNFAFAESAVGLEASDTEFLAGDMTFYGRYVLLTGDDGREPLPTTFASTVANGGAFDGTEQLVWRERSDDQPSLTPDVPSDLPLGKDNVTWFDEQTTYLPSYVPPVLPGDPGTELANYELVTHRYGAEAVSFPILFGWQYSNLQTPPIGPFYPGQAWMVTVTSSLGRFQTSRPATSLDSSCVDIALNAKTITVAPAGGLAANPPTVMIFWANFEDFFGGWSEVVLF